MPLSGFAGALVTIDSIPKAKPGDSVVISGTSEHKEVIVKVIRPNATVLYVDVLPVSADKKFSTTIKLPSDSPVGAYKVVAGHDVNVATSDLTVEKTTPTDPPPTGSRPPTGNPPANTGSTSNTAPQTTPPVKNDIVVTNNQVTVKLDKSAQKVTQETVNGVTITKVILDASILADAFKTLKEQGDKVGDNAAKVVAIEVANVEGATKVEIPAETLAKGSKTVPDAMVSVQTESSSYQLPVRVLDVEALAKSLGVNPEEVNISVIMEKLTGAPADQVNSAIKSLGASSLSGAVDFNVTAESKGKSVEVNNFGSTYVERVIVIPGSVNADEATAVVIDPATGEASFVPAIFRKTADGKTEVIIKRNGNSVYSVVAAKKTFADVSNHWARNEINLLASKLLVKGHTETSFSPDSSITRAEFATLLVRALGLTLDKSEGSFTDVRTTDWFAASVNTAIQAKLVNGFENGTFRPNEKITREQMAAMITRALHAAGKSIKTTGTTDEILNPYSDQASISTYAKDSFAQLIDAGIIKGQTSATIAPAADANRAEAVVILKRFLQFVQFINA